MSRGYPSDWGRRRKKVYKRDNYTCQNCGQRGGPYGNAELHAHHVVPKGKGGTHKTSNLKTVCKDCHDAIHGQKKAPTATTNRTKNSNTSTSEIDNIITLSGALAGIGWFVGYYYVASNIILPALQKDLYFDSVVLIVLINVVLLAVMPFVVAVVVSTISFD
jgi:hypothetical protein